tara:strand:+ start:1056 stop:1241 length:186 start_codon:yes stop_codon:yes gene_type:complete
MKMPLLDKILKFTVSKKLTVFIIASIFTLNEVIEGSEWVYISLMYIGTQGAIDLYNSIKKT